MGEQRRLCFSPTYRLHLARRRRRVPFRSASHPNYPKEPYPPVNLCQSESGTLGMQASGEEKGADTLEDVVMRPRGVSMDTVSDACHGGSGAAAGAGSCRL